MRGALALFAGLAFVAMAHAQTSPPASQPAHRFQNDLIAYAAFQGDVSALSSGEITSLAELDAALERAARHNTEALVRGWMSYGANVAAQSPSFVAAVRETGARRGREALARDIAADNAAARQLAGSDDAARLALQAIAADAERIAYAADRLLERSYTLQQAAWANEVAPGQPERVERVRSASISGAYAPAISISVASELAVTPLSVRGSGDSAAFGGRRFWDVLYGRSGVVEVAAHAQPPMSEDVGRGMIQSMTALAAFKALDAEESQASAVNALLNDRACISCVEMARLQFYQCLSAARFVYENSYCLAQHGLRDIAVCMDPSLRARAPALAPTAPPDPTPVHAVIDPAPAPAAPAPVANDGAFLAALGELGPGELFARADELEEEGAAARARTVRRALISRFPDSPLALLAAQQLASRQSQGER